ncbi:PQQ-binding-like beta-propeller repeat protein [Planococcus sp. ISL-109]|uniref:outer membrane protein assembly factor BamB family protein n=1 Tax=Planococcus sp. ISL-109 TaxID=2819166 RepID=UPI001BE662B8|nr:PQQ-binding-like beta-propeller repeat protein [Planococcus sp. ISL-109]MBT2584248.1 PQQ-binding-like beta-propeller repeat protein [Planococcus sp. ISL-109]
MNLPNGLTLVIKNKGQVTRTVGNAVLSPYEQSSVHFKTTNQVREAIRLESQRAIQLVTEIPQSVYDLLNLPEEETPPADDLLYRDEFLRYAGEIDSKIADKAKVVEHEVLWEVKAGEEPIYSTPVFAIFSNGKRVVIYQSWDWYIYVREVETGELVWRYLFGESNYGRPQAADVNGDGKIEIFGASHDGHVYCLNEEGDRVWFHSNLYYREGSGDVTSATEWGITDSTKSWVENSFLRIDGNHADLVITSGTGKGQILKISGVETDTIWTSEAFKTLPDATSTYEIQAFHESDIYYQHAGQLMEEPDGWYLYTTCFDNQCVKLKASTGELMWRFSSLEQNEPFPTIVDIDGDGKLECIFNSIDQHAYCLNAETGTLKWKNHAGFGIDCFGSSADMDNDGVFEYIINGRGGRTLYLDGVTGETKYKSTDWSVWATSETNSRATVFDYETDKKAVVFGGLAGFVYCLDGQANTIWRTYLSANMRGSTNILDVNLDGEYEILVPDMMGTLTILNKHGKEVGQINVKGGIEGTPLVGDLDGDGKIEVFLTSLDGYASMFRFT